MYLHRKVKLVLTYFRQTPRMNKTPSVLTCRRDAAIASGCCTPWLANQLATELVRRSEYTPAVIVRTPARMPNQWLYPVIARMNPLPCLDKVLSASESSPQVSSQRKCS